MCSLNMCTRCCHCHQGALALYCLIVIDRAVPNHDMIWHATMTNLVLQGAPQTGSRAQTAAGHPHSPHHASLRSLVARRQLQVTHGRCQRSRCAAARGLCAEVGACKSLMQSLLCRQEEGPVLTCWLFRS